MSVVRGGKNLIRLTPRCYGSKVPGGKFLEALTAYAGWIGGDCVWWRCGMVYSSWRKVFLMQNLRI